MPSIPCPGSKWASMAPVLPPGPTCVLWGDPRASSVPLPIKWGRWNRWGFQGELSGTNVQESVSKMVKDYIEFRWVCFFFPGYK